MGELTEEIVIREFKTEGIPVSTASIVHGECVGIWYEDSDKIDIVFRNKVHNGVDGETYGIHAIPAIWSNEYARAVQRIAGMI